VGVFLHRQIRDIPGSPGASGRGGGKKLLEGRKGEPNYWGKGRKTSSHPALTRPSEGTEWSRGGDKNIYTGEDKRKEKKKNKKMRTAIL